MRTSETDLLILHTIRLKGFVDGAEVAEVLGLDRGAVEQRLEHAGQDGLVRHREGARSGWSLTEEGRKENERLLAEELDQAGVRAAVTGAYHRFIELNQPFLAVCTAWQVVDVETQTLNDHGDADYDRAVLDRLAALDHEIQPICGDLASWLARFDRYGPRFRHANDRIERGDTEWFTRPTLDSYHTVWFELHEDLLATLGLDRAAETTRTTANPTETEEH